MQRSRRAHRFSHPDTGTSYTYPKTFGHLWWKYLLHSAFLYTKRMTIGNRLGVMCGASRTSVFSRFSPVSRRACTFQRTRRTIKSTYFLLISLHLCPHEHSALVNSTLIFLCIFGFFVPSLHPAQAVSDCCVPCGGTVYIAMLNWELC